MQKLTDTIIFSNHSGKMVISNLQYNTKNKKWLGKLNLLIYDGGISHIDNSFDIEVKGSKETTFDIGDICYVRAKEEWVECRVAGNSISLRVLDSASGLDKFLERLIEKTSAEEIENVFYKKSEVKD
jgi:hypothetical protein